MIFVASLGLASCFESPSRPGLPHSQIESAQIPGYPNVRIWGDEISASYVASIRTKDEQVRIAAGAGHEPLGREHAAFLAISGGGDQGAFGAGVLTGWSERGTRPRFEVVTGVSAGALGAPFAFLGPKYDNALRDIYTRMSARDLYNSRGVRGYFDDALNDTAPLRRAIEQYVTEEFLDEIGAAYRNGRRILILTTNLDAERPVIWDVSAIAASGRADRRDLFVKVLLASSALPGLFPPIYFHVVGADGRQYDEMHVDGGATAQLVFVPPEMNVVAIEQSVFGKVRDRSLFVIRNGKINPEYESSEARAVPIASRAVATLVKYQAVADLARLDRFAKANKSAFFFCAVPGSFDAQPKTDFDTVYATKLFAEGVRVGRNNLWSSTPPTSPSQYLP